MGEGLGLGVLREDGADHGRHRGTLLGCRVAEEVASPGHAAALEADFLIRPSLPWAGLYIPLEEFQGVTSTSVANRLHCLKAFDDGHALSAVGAPQSRADASEQVTLLKGLIQVTDDAGRECALLNAVVDERRGQDGRNRLS
jgi:hypothetical protein